MLYVVKAFGFGKMTCLEQSAGRSLKSNKHNRWQRNIAKIQTSICEHYMYMLATKQHNPNKKQ